MNTTSTRPAAIAAGLAWLRTQAARLPAAPAALRTTAWRAPALAFAVPLSLLMIFEWLAFSPWGSDWLILVDVALFGLASVALLAAAFHGLVVLWPRLRSPARLRRLALLALFVAGTVAGMQASQAIRANGMQRVAAHGDRIVAALVAYEARNGSPPATLTGLVPDFLPELPGTGLGSRPDFRYAVRYGDAGHETWSLWTKLPGLGHGSDFEYLPADAVQPWDTVLQRVGAWAVVAND